MQKLQTPLQVISLLPEFQHTASENKCVANAGFYPPHKTLTSLTNSSGIEVCDFIHKITTAVESGMAHAGANFVPEPFATADGFETFLCELNLTYQHSVDGWKHAFRSVVEAADAIRRSNAVTE
jgi:hypothetical protein